MKKSAKPVDTRIPAHSSSTVSAPLKPADDAFSRAMRFFHGGDYRKAKPLFEEAAGSHEASPLSETARMYARMCEQRLHREAPVLETAEDRYNYGIRLLNERRYADAWRSLRDALGHGDSGGHLHYALALAAGLQGDWPNARQHFREAIQLDTRIRNLARGDTDFRPLLEDNEIRRLVREEDAPHS